MTGIAMLLAFFVRYHTYIQDIIYEERLNQMEEITQFELGVMPDRTPFCGKNFNVTRAGIHADGLLKNEFF